MSPTPKNPGKVRNVIHDTTLRGPSKDKREYINYLENKTGKSSYLKKLKDKIKYLEDIANLPKSRREEIKNNEKIERKIKNDCTKTKQDDIQVVVVNGKKLRFRPIKKRKDDNI
jgi:flagellar motility protein MotE (MotC chaperone)